MPLITRRVYAVFITVLLNYLANCWVGYLVQAASPILNQDIVQFESAVPTKIPDVVLLSSTLPIDLMRVRLFPLISVPAYEPYPETINFNEVEIIHEGGLVVYQFILENGDGVKGSVLGEGIRVAFDFKKRKIKIDPSLDSRYEGEALALETVWIQPKEGVDSIGRVIWNKGLQTRDENGEWKSAEVNLRYRGEYVVAPSWVPTRLAAEDITPLHQNPHQNNEDNNPNKSKSAVFEGWKEELYWSVINRVNIEVYLHSVIPSEVYPSWPEATLQAQALAARTYGIRQAILSRLLKRLWDVDPTTRFQSYRGVALEKPSTTKAAQATAEKIMTYQGGVIEALYSANSGGIVCSSADCFGIHKGYLKSRVDVDGVRDVPDGSGSWTAVTCLDVIRKLLKDELGLDPTRFTKLAIGRIGEIVETDLLPRHRTWTLKAEFETGHPVELTYQQTKKTFSRFRSALYTISDPRACSQSNPYCDSPSRTQAASLETSSGISLSPPAHIGDGSFAHPYGRPALILPESPRDVITLRTRPNLLGVQKITGYGFGHGVGMSQWGAYLLAKQGKSAEEIVKFYYDGIRIGKLR